MLVAAAGRASGPSSHLAHGRPCTCTGVHACHWRVRASSQTRCMPCSAPRTRASTSAVSRQQGGSGHRGLLGDADESRIMAHVQPVGEAVFAASRGMVSCQRVEALAPPPAAASAADRCCGCCANVRPHHTLQFSSSGSQSSSSAGRVCSRGFHHSQSAEHDSIRQRAGKGCRARAAVHPCVIVLTVPSGGSPL